MVQNGIVVDTMQQLILPFKPETAFVFDNFYDKNSTVVDELKSITVDNGFLRITGNTGKTHVLQATCHFAKSCGKSFNYIPLKQFINLPDDALDFPHQFDVLCVDDIEVISGNIALEKKLFEWFNRAYDTKLTFIASSKTPTVDFTLADLNSRINSLKILDLKKLNDVELRNTLVLHANYLSIVLDNKVLQYILSHLPRNLTIMVDLLKKLSSASLLEQRKITVQFVKTQL